MKSNELGAISSSKLLNSNIISLNLKKIRRYSPNRNLKKFKPIYSDILGFSVTKTPLNHLIRFYQSTECINQDTMKEICNGELLQMYYIENTLKKAIKMQISSSDV